MSAGKKSEKSSQVVLACHKHWIAYLGPGFLAALIVLSGLATLFASVGTGLILILIGLIVYGVSYLCIHSECIILNTTNITGKKGLIKTITLVAPISKVQDVAIRNGLMGKLLGYHTITVTTAGSAGTEYVLTQMADAEEFQQKYIELVEFAN